MNNNMRTKTIKASCYHDEGFFNKEVETIFKKEWQWVGRSESLKKPGDFIATKIVDYPIILIKNKLNKTLGFHNVCRHRASKVILQSEGNCKKIICPYHGWNYDLDGKLSNPSNFFGSADFNHKNHSLFPISVEEKYGLIFANLDSKSLALNEWLGIFSKTINQHYKDDLIFHNELSFDVHANWKTYVDNYQEGYHIPSVHPQLNRDVIWEEYSIENNGSSSVHSVPERANSKQPGSFGWTFPNFIFNVYGRGIVFQRIEPIKPKWCRVVYNLFRPLDVSSDDFESNEGKYQLEVSLEDQNLIPDIQQNLQSGIYNTGPLSMKYEASVAFFHDLLIKKISKGV
jgi:choline monooxygenase